MIDAAVTRLERAATGASKGRRSSYLTAATKAPYRGDYTPPEYKEEGKEKDDRRGLAASIFRSFRH